MEERNFLLIAAHIDFLKRKQNLTDCSAHDKEKVAVYDEKHRAQVSVEKKSFFVKNETNMQI